MSDVILFSGGMDSFLVKRLAAPHAQCVFVDLGQRYIMKELAAAEAWPDIEVLRAHGVMQGDNEVGDTGIIPFRNANLIIAAAATAYNLTQVNKRHSDQIRIYLGVIGDEINSDKSSEFFKKMEEALNISCRAQYWNNDRATTFKILAPLSGISKTDAVRKYIASGGDVDDLLKTVSCYSPSAEKQCGRCASCFKRWVAMILNGIDEPYEYSPKKWAIETGIDTKARSGVYSLQRSRETLDALAIG